MNDTHQKTGMELIRTMHFLGQGARNAVGQLARASSTQKNQALAAAATMIAESQHSILAANRADMDEARAKGLSSAMLDRLALDEGYGGCPLLSHGCRIRGQHGSQAAL